MSVFKVDKLMSEARRLAAEYRRATGKPLVNSSELAEFDACRLLNLDLCEQKQAGFDAIGTGQREGKRIQIKGRAIFDDSKGGHRIGQLKIDQSWDSVMLVIMDDNLEPMEIFETERADILQAMDEQNSKRAKRGAMSVAKFKNIGQLVWAREDGEISNE